MEVDPPVHNRLAAILEAVGGEKIMYVLYIDWADSSYYISEEEGRYKKQIGTFRAEKESYSKETIMAYMEELKMESKKYTVFFNIAAGDAWYEETNCFDRGDKPKYAYSKFDSEKDAIECALRLRSQC